MNIHGLKKRIERGKKMMKSFKHSPSREFRDGIRKNMLKLNRIRASGKNE